MRDSTRTTRPLSRYATARKRPGSVNETVVIDLPSTLLVPTLASLRSAAFSTPYGVTHSECDAVDDEARTGRRAAGRLVPREVAVQVLLVALRRRVRIAAAARRFGAGQHDLLAHRARVVVDGARPGVELDLGPGFDRLERLPERPAPAVAGVADRLQVVDAQCGGGALEGGVGGGGVAGESQAGGEQT